jgi:prepilin peptidase CpaA
VFILEIVEKVLCAAFLAAASFYDVYHFVKDKKGRIPNWLNLSALLAGLALHAASGNLPGSVSGAVWGLFFGLVFYVLGLFGAGDAKMLAGMGALAGQEMTFLTLLCGLTCLVLWSAPLRLCREGIRKFWEHEKQGLFFLAARIRLKPVPPEKFDPSRLPLAPFVAAGYLAALLIQQLGVIAL